MERARRIVALVAKLASGVAVFLPTVPVDQLGVITCAQVINVVPKMGNGMLFISSNLRRSHADFPLVEIPPSIAALGASRSTENDVSQQMENAEGIERLCARQENVALNTDIGKLLVCV